MATVHDIATRMRDFVQNIDSNINDAVVTVDYLILDLNREQMKDRQVTANDQPIQPEYSSQWKSIKGLTYPNLFNTGAFQKGMVLNIDYPRLDIHSTDWKDAKLRAKYQNIFGVASSNRPAAYSITNKAIANLIKSKVFK